jgi:hypothetical protein
VARAASQDLAQGLAHLFAFKLGAIALLGRWTGESGKPVAFRYALPTPVGSFDFKQASAASKNHPLIFHVSYFSSSFERSGSV